MPPEEAALLSEMLRQKERADAAEENAAFAQAAARQYFATPTTTCGERDALKARLDKAEAGAKAATDPAAPQPPPIGDGTPILPLVLRDFQARGEAGQKKYGTPLRANNGRNALIDAYQEAQDLCLYLRQKIEEGA
jgi:hypothetical protein